MEEVYERSDVERRYWEAFFGFSEWKTMRISHRRRHIERMVRVGPVANPHAPENALLRRERFGHHGSQGRSRPTKELTQLMALIKECAL